MITIDQLNEQNIKIKELSSVLGYLFESKEMCNTEATCDLFLQYAEQVVEHLYVEEKEVYRELLTHDDIKVKNTTKDFFSGSVEIKRVFNEYVGRWCKKKQLRVIKHTEFVQDSKEIFDLVLNRIEAETNILYPMVQKTGVYQESLNG